MIIGLTDRPQIRRDGKIRAGTGPKSGGFNNPDHFLLRDAPQLTQVLGTDKPKEIYFTFHSDNPAEVSKIDLRWYSATQLLCQSMHNTADKSRPIGQWAAYKGVQDVPGVTQEQYMGLPKARKRQCGYKSCPNYIREECGEHLFLNVMVPQYGLGSIFTLDSVSIIAVQNILGLFEKAGTQVGGKFSGEIFRMFKKKDSINFMDTKSGKQAKRDAFVVDFEYIPYAKYLELFGDKLSKENREALERLRQRPYMPNYSMYLGASLAAMQSPAQIEFKPVAVPEIGFDESEPEAETPPAVAQPAMTADEVALLARANHEALAPLFVELSALAGIANTEGARVATAKNLPTVEALATYLKDKIAKAKAAQKANKPAVAAPVEPAPAVQTPPPATRPAPVAVSSMSESPLF